jgi:hypothetical protein
MQSDALQLALRHWMTHLIPDVCPVRLAGTASALKRTSDMTEREAKTRAVKILAKSIYRDLEAQGFDEKQIVALATELISEVTAKMARGDKQQQVA